MRHGRLIGRLVLVVGLLGGMLAAAGPARADVGEHIDVRRMVLGGTHLSPRAQQLLQVTLANTNPHALQLGLRAELRDDHDRRIGPPLLRRVTLPGRDEERYLFQFTAPAATGNYSVRFEVLTGDFKHPVIPGAPVYYSPFAVGVVPPPGKAAAAVGAKINVPSFLPPSGLKFEKPDLLWDNVTISPDSVLLGGTLHIKADLRNVGGDIARNVPVQVDYYNTRTPGHVVSISRSTVHILAPGEEVEMEFDTVFPDDALLGEYRVRLSIDPGNTIDELDKHNNVFLSQPIRLARIKLVFPQAGYAFEEQGLFLFRWDSLRYDQFKVEVGTSPKFDNPDDYFDIPQGDKWTKDKELVPLEGELPVMAQGLLQKTRAKRLYWRVEGRDSKTGRTDYSAALPFTIKPSPAPKEQQPPAAMPLAPPANGKTAPGGAGPSGSQGSAAKGSAPADQSAPARGAAPPAAGASQR